LNDISETDSGFPKRRCGFPSCRFNLAESTSSFSIADELVDINQPIAISFRRKFIPAQTSNLIYLNTGGPRNSWTFYLRICLFTLWKVVQNNNFLVKNGLFICEFRIRSPKWRIVSTANFEGNLYCKVE